MVGRFFALLMLVACAPEAVEPGTLPSGFARSTGCGDVELVLVDALGENALLVRSEGVVAMAHALEDVVQRSWDLPHPEVTVELITGENLFALTCEADGDAVVDDVMEPSAGRLSLNVTPQGGVRQKTLPGARVDVVAEDLLLEGDPGHQIAIPSLDEDVLVQSVLR
jgi:hypothetical protein